VDRLVSAVVRERLRQIEDHQSATQMTEVLKWADEMAPYLPDAGTPRRSAAYELRELLRADSQGLSGAPLLLALQCAQMEPHDIIALYEDASTDIEKDALAAALAMALRPSLERFFEVSKDVPDGARLELFVRMPGVMLTSELAQALLDLNSAEWLRRGLTGSRRRFAELPEKSARVLLSRLARWMEHGEAPGPVLRTVIRILLAMRGDRRAARAEFLVRLRTSSEIDLGSLREVLASDRTLARFFRGL